MLSLNFKIFLLFLDPFEIRLQSYKQDWDDIEGLQIRVSYHLPKILTTWFIELSLLLFYHDISLAKGFNEQLQRRRETARFFGKVLVLQF